MSGYRVAGKTGTAHKLEDGRYVNRYVASFVGFAPVSNPRLVVAVMIDEPSNGEYYGGAGGCAGVQQSYGRGIACAQRAERCAAG